MGVKELKARQEARKAAGANQTYPRHAKGAAPPRVARALRMAPCAHQGARLPGQPCGSPLVACALHGTASRFRACQGAARVCQSCADYRAG